MIPPESHATLAMPPVRGSAYSSSTIQVRAAAVSMTLAAQNTDRSVSLAAPAMASG